MPADFPDDIGVRVAALAYHKRHRLSGDEPFTPQEIRDAYAEYCRGARLRIAVPPGCGDLNADR